MGQENSSAIFNSAKKLGFSQAAIVKLEKNSDASKYFKDWLSQNYQGEMHYLERGLDKREDPEKILSGAKSIICLAWSYEAHSSLYQREVRRDLFFLNPPSSPFAKGGDKNSPFISRYAWGEDYHLLLQRKLEELQQQLKIQFPHSQFKSYVDTGPIMEKAWAAKAGLGWIGKHTNLIHPQQGSYFFLASILTDLTFDEIPNPINDHCGKCKACIDICPTKAIVAPYIVDARLCISYLTIELKGPIPRELRSQIGNHVFGCDDCQEVCPWNRKAKLPLEFLKSASVDELHFYLTLDKQSFKKYFENTPLLRSKRKGFLRNVCVVLGNLKQENSLLPLQNALQDEEALIRGHAAWALGCYAQKELRPILEKTLQNEKDLWVREELCQILKKSPL